MAQKDYPLILSKGQRYSTAANSILPTKIIQVMFTKLSLENFKAFRTLKSLELKPLTLLCGTNSSGKSSIIQSILTGKQTLESKELNRNLLLNGKYVHLGSFSNVSYRQNIGNRIGISYEFRVNNVFYQTNFPNRRSPIFSSLITLSGLYFKENVEYYLIQLDMEISGDTIDNNRSVTLIENYKINIKGITSSKREIAGPSVELIRGIATVYDIIYENLRESSSNFNSHGSFAAAVTFSNLFPQRQLSANIDFSTTPGNIKTRRMAHYVDRFLDIMRNLLTNSFNSTSYIGPLREEPSRRYIYEDEVHSIGTKGENAAYLYNNYFSSGTKNGIIFNKDSETFINIDNVNNEGLLNTWLDYIGISNLHSKASNEIINIYLNSYEQNSFPVNIADVGFGISQIFPILVEGLRIAEGHTLILEQPEIHLHPNLQMKMADFFIGLALSKKQVILETHSEHIVNRLVRRIIEDKAHNISDLVNIYFITSSSNGPVIEKVNIDPIRGITNWPKEFFDQAALEQEKIILSAIEKRKKK